MKLTGTIKPEQKGWQDQTNRNMSRYFSRGRGQNPPKAQMKVPDN